MTAAAATYRRCLDAGSRRALVRCPPHAWRDNMARNLEPGTWNLEPPEPLWAPGLSAGSTRRSWPLPARAAVRKRPTTWDRRPNADIIRYVPSTRRPVLGPRLDGLPTAASGSLAFRRCAGTGRDR